MALTPDEENKIRQLLARESEQEKEKLSSSLENFQKWLKLVLGIVKTISEIVHLYKSFFG
ncbi:hypothetical protein VB834_11355 [Limnoraphis robusta Tam1]|uniref:hypothetical protein n=1 Tax=Limnoraphis robusta TaxID=1118279 RepID=UPI002B21BCA0|nr:hypothetical protein [Limnoraphis robusta]MEA5500016.1 hypothetical protein [Limnoraphis robusta BA-68 BA1]MEA5539629.1 hypothetical protein [Limnoraphis robusta Tam1]